MILLQGQLQQEPGERQPVSPAVERVGVVEPRVFAVIREDLALSPNVSQPVSTPAYCDMIYDVTLE